MISEDLRQKLTYDVLPNLRKRPKAVLQFLLEHEEVSTYQLGEMGYDQPPRAAQDLKEAGVKLLVRNGQHPTTGSRMAIYSIDPDQSVSFQQGRIAFPKIFTQALFEAYGFRCNITGAILPSNALQVDHRVPFIVKNDDGVLNPLDFQPLSASAQRSKSWACEHCPNSREKDLAMCKSCFWASPESYSHVAGVVERQINITFQSEEIAKYDQLKLAADIQGLSVGEFIKRMLMSL